MGSSAGVEHLGPEFDPNIGGGKLNMAITMWPRNSNSRSALISINHDG